MKKKINRSGSGPTLPPTPPHVKEAGCILIFKTNLHGNLKWCLLTLWLNLLRGIHSKLRWGYSPYLLLLYWGLLLLLLFLRLGIHLSFFRLVIIVAIC